MAEYKYKFQLEEPTQLESAVKGGRGIASRPVDKPEEKDYLSSFYDIISGYVGDAAEKVLSPKKKDFDIDSFYAEFDELTLRSSEEAALQRMEAGITKSLVEGGSEAFRTKLPEGESLRPVLRDDTTKADQESTPVTVEDSEYTTDIDISSLSVPKAAGYKEKDIVSYSYYNKPLVEGGVRGNSRKGGDASEEVQKRSIQAIIKAGTDAGMSADDIALTLAIARHESGFNPDAAAGTTSAHGLGQFVDKTGASYGLTDDNRWDVDVQAKALVVHTLDNIKLAESRGKPRSYVYKYHHDGPSKDYGGLTTSTKKVMPYVDRFKEMLGVTMNEDTTPEESPRPRLRPAGLMSR